MEQMKWTRAQGEEEYEQTACEHLIEIAKIAKKYGLYLTPDYYFDDWTCPICNCRCIMEDLMQRV